MLWACYHLCSWNHMEGHWRSVFSLEKYFPSLSPLPFFNLQNLANVLFTMNCFVGKFDKCCNVANNLHVWRPMVCRDLWWTEPRPQSRCQFENRLLTQWQHSTLQQTTWCTILQLLPNQSYTIAYSSLIAAMSLQLTNNHSIILVPMEETLLHKL